MNDLELKNLNQFFGTEQYHKINLFKSNLTDGIIYLMENGYSWFITDSLSVIENDEKCLKEEFLCIKLEVKGTTAKMTITDGNDKILYTQDYGYTDAKKDLKLFYANNVLLLSGEY